MATEVDSEAPDITRWTRRQLADEITSVKAEIDALRTAGGTDLKALDNEQTELLQALLDVRDFYQEEFDSRPDPAGLKARMGPPDTKAVSRPPLGGGDSGGAGHDSDDIKAGESELDKYIQRGPWKSLGHFAYALRQDGGAEPGRSRVGVLGDWNERVKGYDRDIKALADDQKAISGLSEFSDPDGAAFVPTEISNQVWERAMSLPNLLSMVDQTPVSGNGYSMTAWNDATLANGVLFGGVQAYWTDEAAQYTGVKPKTRKVTWKLNKLTVLMYATDELLEDTIALDARLAKVAGMAFAYKINDAIVNGTGAGQPMGLLASPCKVTAAAVSGQGANTVVATNIDKMWKRRPYGASDLVWLYNRDLEDQFAQLSYVQSSTNTGLAATWLYIPPNGIAGVPGGTLKGRPIQEVMNCPALGTEGDLILWQPSSYGAIVKATGINQAVSMHLRFDYGELAYRWSFRMDGRPFWDSALTLPNSSNTLSPIVTLNSTRT